MLVIWDIEILATSIKKDDSDALINFGKFFGDVSHVQKSQGAILSLVVRNYQTGISVVHSTMALQKHKVHLIKA
jgi:hypothetical protein